MTPQARAASALRAEGWLVEVVEQIRTVPGRTWRIDPFGGFDLLAINAAGEVRAVQVTTRSHVSTRVKKITDLPALGWLRKAGWRIEVWGWGKTKAGEWKVVDLS